MYIEGEVPYVGGNNYNNGWGGNGDWWAIILLAALFGWGGNGGFGFGGGRGYGGSEVLGYELGKVATTNDVASGFNNSAVLSSLNDIKLGQAQMQNWINQGFPGINTQLLTGFHGVDNSVCTLGYQASQLANGLSRELAGCCCDIKSMILENRYLNEKQTCDIITNANANTQKVIDYMQCEKINALTAENTALKGKISNANQTTEIISALAPKAPVPAYPVFPATSFAHPTGVTFGWGGNNSCCGCGQF
jgi:hypothetical protein